MEDGELWTMQHIYGLPSKSPEEQQQADEGTLLASRSVEIIGTILKDQRKRRVPQAGTLENPLTLRLSGGGARQVVQTRTLG